MGNYKVFYLHKIGVKWTTYHSDFNWTGRPEIIIHKSWKCREKGDVPFKHRIYFCLISLLFKKQNQ